MASHLRSTPGTTLLGHGRPRICAWSTRWTCSLLAALVLATAGGAASAQTKPIWQETLPNKPMALDTTDFRTGLVQTKTGLFAVELETGKHVWTRTDVTRYELVPDTPFALFTTAEGQTLGNLESGTDVWKVASLGLSKVEGMLHLGKQGMVLVYGPPSETGHAVVAVKYETGEVLWKQTDLFTAPSLSSKAKKNKYHNYLADTDQSVVLDPSIDGLMRLDLATGRVLWRLAEDRLPVSLGREITLFAAGGQILVEYGKTLMAINQETGKIVWTLEDDFFSSAVVQVASTPYGLLVRGAYNVRGAMSLVGRPGTSAWNPYLAMLDPATGAAKWHNKKGTYKGRSEFLVEDDTAVVALEEGVAIHDLATGKVQKTVRLPKFSGDETACCLKRLEDGRLFMWSSQNMRMLDPTLKLTYSVYFKAPGMSGIAKFATVAPAAGAAGAMSAASGGTYTMTTTPGADFYSKFKATTTTERYSYIFAEDVGPGPTKFALLRIDNETGKDTGRVWFADRFPVFKVDPDSGVVLTAKGPVLSALRCAPAPK